MLLDKKKVELWQVIKHLEVGGILIYPTETAYAIGGDAANQKAVDLIFKIKNRPKNKTLPLIAGSLAMVKRYCRLSAVEERLARKYWPGPVTLVLRRGEVASPPLSSGVMAKDGTIAVRVSSNKIARELSRRLGRPIVSTSANVAGQGECYSIRDIQKHFRPVGAYGHTPLQIIDGGKLKKRRPSTIIRLSRGGRIKTLRQGNVKILNIGY